MRELFMGQVVMIYHDPLTEKSKEGKAILLRKNYEDPPELMPRCETWLVKFGTGEKIARAILVESLTNDPT